MSTIQPVIAFQNAIFLSKLLDVRAPFGLRSSLLYENALATSVDLAGEHNVQLHGSLIARICHIKCESGCAGLYSIKLINTQLLLCWC